MNRQKIVVRLMNMQDVPRTKKSLGQHWLHDEASLQAMVDAAEVGPDDTVLEIGPGPGALTSLLVKRAKQVVAVEFDESLAQDLSKRVPADNLAIVRQDILRFDLNELPPGYKVAANIPYYLTSNLLKVLCEAPNHFSKAALLVQKEVAERVCAAPGAMSILSVSVQLYCDVALGAVVPAVLFTPPPKVDSQILQLTYRAQPRFAGLDSKQFFRVVKAGFSQRRKTLLNSLSAGLHIDKQTVETALTQAAISPNSRAQSLNLAQWHALAQLLAQA